MCRSSQGPKEPHADIVSAEFSYHEIAGGDRMEYARYCAYFYDSTFNVIARFSAIKDSIVLCELTEAVFLHLWENREQFMQVSVRGGLLYRTTIQVIVLYMNEWGNNERIEQIIATTGVKGIFHETKKSKDGQET